MNLEVLLIAICLVESSGNPKAINHRDGNGGSFGYCQVSMRTAKELDPTTTKALLLDKEHNQRLALTYLTTLAKQYEGDELIAAYNSGHPIYRNGKLINAAYVRKVKTKLIERSKANDH